MSPRRRAGSGGPRPVGAFLGRAASDSRLGPALRRGRAMSAWPAAVGPQLARLTWPVALQGKTLVVAVHDHALATVLQFQLPAILERLTMRTGGAINTVRLTVQPKLPSSAEEAVGDRPPALPRQPPRSGDPSERLELARRRLRELWRSRETPRCEVCGAVIHTGDPAAGGAAKAAGEVAASPAGVSGRCASCTRLLCEPRVLALARRLVGGQDLPGELDELDAAAAILRARERLAADLRELASQVIADGSLRPYLDALARRYLQLAGWKGPVERGAHLLPAPEVAGLLGWS